MMGNEAGSRKPLVSILIPCYNRATWVGQAIESALQQDYSNLEVVVCDDGSTDNSDQVIRRYSHDPRLKYTRNEKNIGMIANFNKIFFDLAQGRYVTLLGSDDYLVNLRFISKAIGIINDHDNISIVFGKSYFVNADGKSISEMNAEKKGYDIEMRNGHEVFLDFATQPYVYQTSAAVLYSISHLKENNIFFEGRVTADIEFNLQLMLTGNVGFINEQAYAIRQHGANASASFKSLEELEFSYLDLIRLLYRKAEKVMGKNASLKKWYEKTISRNLERSLYMVMNKKNRRLTMQFHSLLVRKYRKEYLSLLTRHPRYIAKLLLNK